MDEQPPAISSSGPQVWIEKTLVAKRADRLDGDNALGKALWSPTASTSGASIYSSMRKVNVGDFVLHLTDNQAITGISQVYENAQDFVGPDNTEWAGRPAYRVELTGFTVLEPPLTTARIFTSPFRERLLALIEQGQKNLFFSSRASLNQGAYLTPVTPALLGILNDAYKSVANRPLLEIESMREDPIPAFSSLVIQSTPPRKAPLNLVLYGPPGTGKTYRTALEAVTLCDGSAPQERSTLMERYRSLVAAKRIAFVTFHQNYAYEDFVEGLRPTNGTAGDDESSSGFSLRVQDGIFKQISKLAGTSHGGNASSESTHLDSHRKIFKMSLGRSNVSADDWIYEDAIAKGFIVLGWGGEIDWSGPEYETFDAIKAKWNNQEPGATSNDPNIVQINTLRTSMEIGSYVVVSEGNHKFRAVGVVESDYYFEEGPEGNHRRKVRWLWHAEDGLAVDVIYSKVFSQASIYQLIGKLINWDALSELVSGPVDGPRMPENFVLVIDEINRANISKVFGELITLVEPDKRAGQVNSLSVTLPYSHETFDVPANLYIVGTMNTADRSIALLDTALRRRFHFKELMPDPTLLGIVDAIDLRALLTRINDRIEYLFDRDHQIGHAYFIDCLTRADIDAVMRETVIPLLVEYFYEDWEKVRSVLGESDDEGAFLRRSRLDAITPQNADDDNSEPRWRYTVRSDFQPNAYQQLLQ